MGLFMTIYVPRRAAFIRADVALVQANVRVSQDVALKRCLVGGSVLALRAGEGSRFEMVVLDVGLKRNPVCRGETAVVADVRPLPRVLAHVLFQIAPVDAPKYS